MEQEQRIRTTINTKNKNNKNNINNENKRKKLGEIRTTYRWITEYITENNAAWEQDLERYRKLEQENLNKQNNLTRKEKVEQIKQEIQEGTTIDRNRIAEKLVENNKTWNVWETTPTITSIPETRTTEITPSTENQQHDGTTNPRNNSFSRTTK